MSELYLAGMGNLDTVKTDLFFAGDYSSVGEKYGFTDIHLLGYNRLLSYDYQKKLVDTIISRRKMMQETKKLDLYLAGAEWELGRSMPDKVPHNVLFSYEFGKKLNFEELCQNNFPKIFIDSGAYSMWTRGIQVNVDEYINWINERADYIDLFGQIDVIPGTKEGGASYQEVKEAAQKTWENYLYMRERVRYPERLLYTFHVGEPKEYLEQAMNWTDKDGNYIPYIALGGMVGKTSAVRRNFLNMCFDIIKKSPNSKVKVHAFGMTSRDLLAEFPITSADSTSWIMTAANGGIITDLGVVNVSEKRKNLPEHYSHLPENMLDEFIKEAGEFEFTLEQLSTDRNARVVHNARYVEDRVSKIQYKPGIKRRKLF